MVVESSSFSKLSFHHLQMLCHNMCLCWSEIADQFQKILVSKPLSESLLTIVCTPPSCWGEGGGEGGG